MMRALAVSLCLGASALIGVAAAEDKEEEKASEEEAGDPRVGEEVDSICFGRNINGWKTTDDYEDAVLLEKGVNDWFLVEVSRNCGQRQFRFAQTIGIESRPAGGCVRRNDVIIVSSGGGFKDRCFIRSIYEWDDDALEEKDEE